MEEFQLPEDQERIRQVVFPHMSPVEYAAMLITKKAQFATLSPESQSKIRAAVDRMGKSLAELKKGGGQGEES